MRVPWNKGRKMTKEELEKHCIAMLKVRRGMPESKICIDCSLEKPISAFYKFLRSRDKKYDIASSCKQCSTLRSTRVRKSKQDTIEYKEYYRKYRKEYYVKNRDKWLIVMKNYREKRKANSTAEELNERKRIIYLKYKLRRKVDIQFRLRVNLRARLKQALKKSNSPKEYRKSSTMEYIGLNYKELKEYLESKFLEGMSWENYGKWHIDHIYPMSKVDLTKQENIKKVMNYKNLQCLWAVDNIKKGAKIL